MAFGTYKPCHGCGETGWKPVNRLCKACQGALRAGQAAVEEVKAPKGEIAFRLTQEWPGIYSPGGETRKLGEAFTALAQAASSRLRSKAGPYSKDVFELPPKGDSVHYFSTHDDRATLWTGKKKVVDAIVALDLLVRAALRGAYDEGKRDGADLLMQLARGEISVKQINEETAKEDS